VVLYNDHVAGLVAYECGIFLDYLQKTATHLRVSAHSFGTPATDCFFF